MSKTIGYNNTRGGLSIDRNNIVTKYDGYLINRYRSHTRGREINRKTTKRGVVVFTQNESYSTAIDLAPMSETVEYYSAIKEIIKLDYYGL